MIRIRLAVRIQLGEFSMHLSTAEHFTPNRPRLVSICSENSQQLIGI